MKHTINASGRALRSALNPPSDSLTLFCACAAWVPFTAHGLDFAAVMRAARDEGWRSFGVPATHGGEVYFTVATMVSAQTGAIRATVNARCPQCVRQAATATPARD